MVLDRRLHGCSSALDVDGVGDVECAFLRLVVCLLWLVAERLLSATFVLRSRSLVILIDDDVVGDAPRLHVGLDVLVGLAELILRVGVPACAATCADSVRQLRPVAEASLVDGTVRDLDDGLVPAFRGGRLAA